MTLLGLLVLLIIAALAGSLGQAIAGYSLGGCVMSMLVGFIGAYLGLWIAGQLGLPEPLTISIQGGVLPLDVVDHRLGCIHSSFRLDL